MPSITHRPHPDPATEALRLEALALLADIASGDLTAATLAELVLAHRLKDCANLADWVETLRRAKLSLLSSFHKTRLTHIALDELRQLVPPLTPSYMLDQPLWRGLMPDPTRTTLTYDEVVNAAENGWWRILWYMPGQESDCQPVWQNPREWVYDLRQGAWQRITGGR